MGGALLGAGPRTPPGGPPPPPTVLAVLGRAARSRSPVRDRQEPRRGRAALPERNPAVPRAAPGTIAPGWGLGRSEVAICNHTLQFFRHDFVGWQNEVEERLTAFLGLAGLAPIKNFAQKVSVVDFDDGTKALRIKIPTPPPQNVTRDSSAWYLDFVHGTKPRSALHIAWEGKIKSSAESGGCFGLAAVRTREVCRGKHVIQYFCSGPALPPPAWTTAQPSGSRPGAVRKPSGSRTSLVRPVTHTHNGILFCFPRPKTGDYNPELMSKAFSHTKNLAGVIFECSALVNWRKVKSGGILSNNILSERLDVASQLQSISWVVSLGHVYSQLTFVKSLGQCVFQALMLP